MKNVMQKMCYLVCILLTLFLFNYKASAKSVSCKYGEDVSVTINIDNSGNLTYKINLTNPDVVIDRVEAKKEAFKKGNGYYCPAQLYYADTQVSSQHHYVVYSSKSTSANATNPLQLTSQKIDNSTVNVTNSNNGVEECSVSGSNCQSLFGNPKCSSHPAYWMQWIFDLVKYVAIILLLVMVTVDFVQALISQDKDALKKASTNAIKRVVFCVIIFFLPMLVELVMSLIGAYGACVS